MIVFTNRFFYPDGSATSQLLSDLAFALARSGFSVSVVCSRRRYDQPGPPLPSHELIQGVEVHRVWTTALGRDRLVGRALDYLTFYLSSAVALLRVLKRGDTVVAKTDPPLLSIMAMMAARIRGAALVNWLQDLFPEVASALGANPLPKPLDVAIKRCRDWSLRAAHTNVVIGARMHDHLARLGVAPSTIRTIENWAELDPAPPKPSAQSALRAQLGLEGAFIVGYSGNLGRAHDWQTLLDAAVALRAEPKIIFLMIGGGAGMRSLRAAVHGLALQSFRFLPYQPREQLGDVLSAADAHWVSLVPAAEGLIVPSKFYGILAAGRPVAFIGDPGGELARAIGEGGCGACVAIGDGAGLAQILREWKDNPSLREQLGMNARRSYVDRYCAERAFDAWRRVLTPQVHVHAASIRSP